jgi:hypothetical protein
MQPRLAHPALGRRLRIQLQVSKDLLNHRPLQDGGDDLELPGAAVRAVLQVGVEHPLEQPCPVDVRRAVVRAVLLALGRRQSQRYPEGSPQVYPPPRWITLCRPKNPLHNRHSAACLRRYLEHAQTLGTQFTDAVLNQRRH